MEVLARISARMGVALNTELVTFGPVEEKGCYGLLCRPRSRGASSGTILAAVPFNYCCAPLLALATPWGPRIRDAISDYQTTRGSRCRLTFPFDSAATTVQCALAAHEPQSPIYDYLQMVVKHLPDMEQSVAPYLDRLTASEKQQYSTLRDMKREIIECVHADLHSSGLEVPLNTLLLADRLCESRCVEMPGSERVFGGPALVPVVDLINHSDDTTNVSVHMLPGNVLNEYATRDRERHRFLDQLGSAHCPFYVVLRTCEHVEEGLEFTYSYMDDEEDKEATDSVACSRTLWLNKFAFLPRKFMTSSSASHS